MASIQDLPPELLLHIFKFCSREDLDRCERVCSLWHKVASMKDDKLAKRSIPLLAIANSSPTNISISGAVKCFHFFYSILDPSTQLVKVLNNSRVKRLVISDLIMNNQIATQISAMLHQCNIVIERAEFIEIDFLDLSAYDFRVFLMNSFAAEEYHFERVSNVESECFDDMFFAVPCISNASVVSVENPGSMNDEDLELTVEDETLIEYFFGKFVQPPLLQPRRCLYIEKPTITPNFACKLLSEFVKAEDLSKSLLYARYFNVENQNFDPVPNVRMQYRAAFTTEWTAYNARNKRVLNAKITTHENSAVDITVLQYDQEGNPFRQSP